MTIRWYPTASELVGSGAHMKGARFEMKLGVRLSAYANPKMHLIKFCVVGPTDAAVEAHAITIAQRIMRNSSGKIMSFKKVLGHYRKDEELPVVAVNRSIYGILGYSPDPAAGDGIEALNLRLFIPTWTGDSATLASLQDVGTGAGAGAQLGVIRWADQDQTTLEAMAGSLFREATPVNRLKVRDEHLVAAADVDGVADGMLSPEEEE